MSDKEVKEFMDKLDAGLKLAEQRMLQEKSLRGESLIIYTEENGIQHVHHSNSLIGKRVLR